jgi:hypothetical protein
VLLVVNGDEHGERGPWGSVRHALMSRRPVAGRCNDSTGPIRSRLTCPSILSSALSKCGLVIPGGGPVAAGAIEAAAELHPDYGRAAARMARGSHETAEPDTFRGHDFENRKRFRKAWRAPQGPTATRW